MIPAAPAADLLPPALAVGLDVIVSIAVLATGIIGWIVQLIQQNRAAPPRANRGLNQPNRPPAEDRLRDEIDSFLSEVSGQKKPAENRRPGPEDPFEEPPRRRPRPAPASDVPDFLGGGPSPPPTTAANRPPMRDRPPRRVAPERPSAPRTIAPPPKPQRKQLRDRHLAKLAKSELGGDLKRHVDRYMKVEQGDLAREHVLRPQPGWRLGTAS